MPPKFKFTKEELVATALDLVRTEGKEALTARNLAQRLGTSPKPIFGLFAGMDDLAEAVMEAALACHHDYVQKEMTLQTYPPYKATGMAYIRFAKEEKELFRMLYLRARTKEESMQGGEDWENAVAAVQHILGLSRQQAADFQLEMWSFVHGIATMFVTDYLDLEMEKISQMLTDVFVGLRHRFLKGEEP